MFLSPILILALLFSSCDDGEKAPETTKVTVASGDITLTPDSTAIAKSENFTVTAAPKEIPEATDVSIKVSYDGTNYTVEGSFNVPKGKEPIDKTELKWESLADVSTATMNVTKLTLKGSYKDGTFTVESGSYTATDMPKGTVTIPKAQIKGDLSSASDGTATVNWGTDGSAFAGSGTWTNVASDPITLNEVPTNTKSIYVQVKLTGGEGEGTYKSEEISITFDDQTATVGDTVNFTKEEPVTVTLSQENVDVTGEGGGSDAIGKLTSGSITLATDNLSETAKQTVESVDGLTITFTAAKKASVNGTLKLKAGKESVGTSVEFTQSIQKGELAGIESISKVVLNGNGEGSEWKVSGIEITAEAGDGA